mgnify:CR=1 FL=1
MRTYAIGDIHGQIDLLRAAHDRIAADRRRCGDDAAPVVHVGDLVDRGPDCAGVIDWLMAGIDAGRPWVVLLGNHDRMFTLFLDNPAAQDAGLRSAYSYLHPAIGGAATLASYGVENPADRPVAKVHAEAVTRVPAAHRAFLAARPLMFRHADALFVHAGIRPGVPPEAQVEDDCVWIREPFLSHRDDHGFLVVHGHTAIAVPTHYGNRVNIDSRAAYGGPLTAVVVEGRDVFLLEDGGRRRLVPDPDAPVR